MSIQNYKFNQQSLRWELRLLLTGDSSRCSQQTPTILSGLQGLIVSSATIRSTHHQAVVSGKTTCSLQPSLQNKQPKIIWRENIDCPGAKSSYRHSYAWTWCPLWTIHDEHKSPITRHCSGSTLGEGRIPPNHTSSGLTVISKLSVLVHQQNKGVSRRITFQNFLQGLQNGWVVCNLAHKSKQQSGHVPPPVGQGRLQSCSSG